MKNTYKIVLSVVILFVVFSVLTLSPVFAGQGNPPRLGGRGNNAGEATCPYGNIPGENSGQYGNNLNQQRSMNSENPLCTPEQRELNRSLREACLEEGCPLAQHLRTRLYKSYYQR